MNILFLDQFSQMGGAQHGLLDTIEAARVRGWLAWAALPPGGPLVSQLASLDVTVAPVPCGPYRSGAKSLPDLFRFGGDLMRQVRLIKDLANRIGFDLIYVNGPRLLPAVALAARGRLPVLFHAHSHVEQAMARKLACWSIRRSGAAVAACSHSVMAQFRDCVVQSKQSVIPNGVRELPFRKRDFPRDGTWRIGVIGRISPEKGQAEFVRAAAILNGEFLAARFFLCGAPMFGDARYFDDVQRLARGLPIEFLGWREDIAAVLSDLDLVVVPSKLEGMGRVAVEAYAAGVPVIAFAVGGIPEIVTDRETGFLVPDKTAQALAGCIREVLRANPADLHRIAANARRAWETRYDTVIYQDRITQLVERLASDRPAERETEAPTLHK